MRALNLILSSGSVKLLSKIYLQRSFPALEDKEAGLIHIVNRKQYSYIGQERIAEFFNSYFVHIDKMMDGYIISVAYGVYGNLRLQRKVKKKGMFK